MSSRRLDALCPKSGIQLSTGPITVSCSVVWGPDTDGSLYLSSRVNAPYSLSCMQVVSRFLTLGPIQNAHQKRQESCEERTQNSVRISRYSEVTSRMPDNTLKKTRATGRRNIGNQSDGFFRLVGRRPLVSTPSTKCIFSIWCWRRLSGRFLYALLQPGYGHL